MNIKGIQSGAVLQRDPSDFCKAILIADFCGQPRCSVGALTSLGGNRWELSGIIAGGPYAITITDDADEITFTDIYVGDLWLLAGQSNMEGAGRLTEELKQEPLSESIRCYSFGNSWAAAAPITHDPWLSKDDCIGGMWRRDMKNSLWNAEYPGEYQGQKVGLRAVGPGYYFAKQMQQQTKVPQGLIPCAKGGSSIKQWTKGEIGIGLYEVMLRRVGECGGVVRGLYWDQGESCTQRSNFLEATLQFFADLRSDLDLPNLPIIQTQIAKSAVDTFYTSVESGIHWSVTKEIQRKMDGMVKNLLTISAADADYDDLIHYSSSFQKTMGIRAAKAMAALMGEGGGLPPVLEKITLRKDEEFAPFNFIFDLHYKNAEQFHSLGVPSGFMIVPKETALSSIVNPSAGIQRIELNGNCISLYTEVKENPQDYDIYYGFGHMAYCNILTDSGYSIPAMGPISIQKGEATDE